MLFSARSLGCAAVLAALCAPLACSTGGAEVGSNEADHTAGAILTQNDTHVWAEASPADFGKGLSTLSGSAERPVAPTDITTLRVNQWLDRYHAIVTQMLADRGERLVAPKPNAALFKENFPNAWVSGALACPAWALSANAGGGTNVSFFLTASAAQVTDATARCIQPQNWTDQTAFGQFWNRQSPACQLGLSGTQLVVGGANCSVYGSQGRLTTYATATTISVTLDEVAWGEEKGVAMTLAHELGHYYRAHSNPNVRKPLNFFYQESPNGPALPVPIADSTRYAQIIDEIRAVPTPIRLTATTRYNKRLTRLLIALEPMCPAAQLNDASLRAVGSGQGTPAQIAEYLAFERAIGTCTQALALTDANIRNTFAQTLYDQRINPALSDGAATIDQALLMISQRFDAVDVDERELVAKVDTGTVGWYTDEQEADEIGLELATRAGFTPNEVLLSNMRMYEQIEEVYRLNNLKSGDKTDTATCKKWLAAGFTETGADGVAHPIRVPLGSLSDTHHEGCYRIYNFWREAKKHNYTVAPPLPALSPAWSVIQQRAIDLGANRAPQLPGDPPVTPGTTTPGGGTTTTPGGGTTTPPGGGTTSPGGGTTSPDGGPVDGTPDPSSSGEPWYNTPKKKPATTPSAPDAGAPAPAVVVTKEGCSAAPGSHGGAATFLAGFAAAALVRVRRRRRTR